MLLYILTQMLLALKRVFKVQHQSFSSSQRAGNLSPVSTIDLPRKEQPLWSRLDLHRSWLFVRVC
jgi:hypothetical protein